MKPLLRSLQDYPPAMLRAMAETHGLELISNVTRAMAEQLASLLADPTHLHRAVASCSVAARSALDQVLRSGGRCLRIPFERDHGAIRAMGPGRLQRERPYLTPASPTEELWYRGLLYSAFAETPDGMAEFLYVPDDLVALLPAPEPSQAGFEVAICRAPEGALPSNDLLVHDICTLLGFVQTGQVVLVDREDPTSWHRTSLYELLRCLLQPRRVGGSHAGILALVLAHDLRWLQPRGRRKLGLDAAAVRVWLDASRDQQRQVAWDAWRVSQRWNDLCTTPSLACEDTGSWVNDPVATRERLLPLLAQLAPGTWHEIDALVAAVKAAAPDFQRPDGVYDTWYIRERNHQTYLRGFESWDAVEGALIRHLVTGPLHWIGLVDLGPPAHAGSGHTSSPGLSSSGPESTCFRLTARGHAWLAAQALPRDPSPAAGLVVLADYSVLVPGAAPLLDRFRVSRFTTWEPPEVSPDNQEILFRYRITQSGLRQAAFQGIDARRILAFLQERAAAPVPTSVVAGLERWHSQSDAKSA